MTEDVFTQSKWQFAARFLEFVGGEDLLEINHLTVAIGDLDADYAAARDRRDNPD